MPARVNQAHESKARRVAALNLVAARSACGVAVRPAWRAYRLAAVMAFRQARAAAETGLFGEARVCESAGGFLAAHARNKCPHKLGLIA